ncbi:(2Fe-2S)-binding protein [Aureibacillus halotolerans]|uniref:BFD-like [2Fe-2S] binding protein n=1 Tax=Aureibacillus halotolerans TaxID=1508390 RepID=A0A4R6TSH1_9BACI|nr:(2Fe-2S)-binding protein [Aureibacillus halotolerans]TDQ35447.1 BFD-like [2Fe-2S] binding protein [Aureibacillus halotolerans]
MTNQQALIVCRCENVTWDDLQQTAKEHHCSARELKLRTRAGMGHCGGRVCRSMINAISQEGHGPPSTLVFRPPVRPIPFHLFLEDGEENE